MGSNVTPFQRSKNRNRFVDADDVSRVIGPDGSDVYLVKKHGRVDGWEILPEGIFPRHKYDRNPANIKKRRAQRASRRRNRG